MNRDRLVQMARLSSSKILLVIYGAKTNEDLSKKNELGVSSPWESFKVVDNVLVLDFWCVEITRGCSLCRCLLIVFYV